MVLKHDNRLRCYNRKAKQMIHPNTELRFISSSMGYGVFATAAIPKGTIVYVKDPLEIEIDPEQFGALPPLLQQQVDRYSYIDELGMRIVSWDLGKYVNHACDCNTMSTGYGFEIALRDIAAGEEITDEYGLFNIPHPMPLNCACTHCRGFLNATDIDVYHEVWDRTVQGALAHLQSVAQPLWSLLSPNTVTEVLDYLGGRCPYRSVLALKSSAGPQIIELSLPADAVCARARRVH